MRIFWLKKIRENVDETHDDIAKEASISRSFYINIELGIKNPSVDVVKKIASVLNFEWTLFFVNECSLKELKYEEVS